MSDAMRKSFGDKAEEKMTPDSSKSTQQKLKEGITGTGDKVAREAQPDDNKSAAQSLGDKAGRSKDNNVHGGTGESMLDKAKGALGMDKH